MKSHEGGEKRIRASYLHVYTHIIKFDYFLLFQHTLAPLSVCFVLAV